MSGLGKVKTLIALFGGKKYFLPEINYLAECIIWQNIKI